MSDPFFHPAIPVLRIFDVPKAKEFYVDFLGCTLDWEHRYTPDLPLYAQVSLGGMTLHLSEHHGDGTPGTLVYVKMTNARAFFASLLAKQARFARPSADCDEADIADPFGNVLRFDGGRP